MFKRIIFLVLYALLVAFDIAAQEPIRLASGEWPPYQSEKLNYGGFASLIITEAFSLEGVEVELGYMPWKRSFYLTSIGDWDRTFLWLDTPERRKVFFISDLKGIRIGATKGYEFGGREFKEAEKSKAINVLRSYEDINNFKLLLKKRQV